MKRLKSKKIRIWLLLFLICIFNLSTYQPINLSTLLYAGTTELTGTFGLQFLKIGIGARPLSMAGAFTSIADDANAVFFNPAGLIEIDKRQASFTHLEWFEQIRYEHLAYVANKKLELRLIPRRIREKLGKLGKLGELKLDNFAGSLSFVTYGNFERKNALGESLGEEFTAYNLAIAFSGAKKILPGLNSGANVKLLYEKIDTVSTIGLAFDFGVKYFPPPFRIWKLEFRNLILGGCLQNFGFTGRSSNKENNFLPLTLRLGASYKTTKIPTGPLTLALDLSLPVDNYPTISYGMEFLFRKLLYLRCGYSYKLGGNDLKNDLAGLSFGIGISIRSYNFDYAYVPYSDLGDTHRFTLLMKF